MENPPSQRRLIELDVLLAVPVGAERSESTLLQIARAVPFSALHSELAVRRAAGRSFIRRPKGNH